MNEKELIKKYQFGFRQKHSTQQAIIIIVDKITKSFDSGDIPSYQSFLLLKKCMILSIARFSLKNCLYMVSVATY